jgi:hypothetical protein
MGERLAVGFDDEVLGETGVVLADLGVAVFDQHPKMPRLGGLVGEVEPHHHASVWESLAGQVDGAPGPQHERRVGVFVAQLQPLFAPVVERPQDSGQDILVSPLLLGCLAAVPWRSGPHEGASSRIGSI